MNPRLQYSQLESAIYQKTGIAELLSDPTLSILAQYCVSDYVGNPALKTDGNPLDNQFAQGFFADQGAFQQHLTLLSAEKLGLAVFATFLAIEIQAGTPQAEFLILSPQRKPEQEGGMYVGLMKSQNTDQLLQQLQTDSTSLAQLSHEVVALLALLRSTTADPANSTRQNWFAKLFKHKGNS